MPKTIILLEKLVSKQLEVDNNMVDRFDINGDKEIVKKSKKFKNQNSPKSKNLKSEKLFKF